MPFRAFLLVESAIFDASESAFGAAGAETSIEVGTGSISGVTAVSTGAMAEGTREAGAAEAAGLVITGTIPALLGELTRFIASAGAVIR
jgi:TRAP-type uncharacterized transport system substrate-binding protein